MAAERIFKVVMAIPIPTDSLPLGRPTCREVPMPELIYATADWRASPLSAQLGLPLKTTRDQSPQVLHPNAGMELLFVERHPNSTRFGTVTCPPMISEVAATRCDGEDLDSTHSQYMIEFLINAFAEATQAGLHEMPDGAAK